MTHTNYCINTITDCFLDWGDTFTRQAPYTTHSSFTYNNTSPYSYILLDFQAPKISESEYSEYPKMDHYLLADGSNVLDFAVTGFSIDDLSILIDDDKITIKESEKERMKLIR